MSNIVMGLTHAGLALYGKVQHGDTVLEITRVIVGSGFLSDGEVIEELAALKNPVDVTVSVTAHEIIGDGQTALYLSFGAASEDYYLREIGVLANDPDAGEILYSYCNFGDKADYIDAYSGKYTIPQEGIIYTAVGTGELEINEAGAAQLTRAEFLEHVNNQNNPHKVTAEQVGFSNKTVLDSITSTMIALWNRAYSAMHTHLNAEELDSINSSSIERWTQAWQHITGKNNPHNVTKAQVGLGNVTNESKASMFTSPKFTGTPTAPTAEEGDNSEQIATTAFVHNSLSAFNEVFDYIDVSVSVSFMPSSSAPGQWHITRASGTWTNSKDSNIIIENDSANDEFDNRMILYGYVANGIPKIGLSVTSSHNTTVIMGKSGIYTLRLYKVTLSE